MTDSPPVPSPDEVLARLLDDALIDLGEMTSEPADYGRVDAIRAALESARSHARRERARHPISDDLRALPDRIRGENKYHSNTTIIDRNNAIADELASLLALLTGDTE